MCIYIFSKYIYLYTYFFIEQSFKELNLASIKNGLTLVVKVKNLKLIDNAIKVI